MNTPHDPRQTYSRILLAALVLGAASIASGCYEDLCPQLEPLPGNPSAGEEASILAVGDSIMAMNGQICQGVAGHAALASNRFVVDHSVGGRRLDHADSDDDIIGQYEPGPWEWVVMTGGGNDMIQECGCNVEGHDEQGCWDTLDSLLDPEAGTGEILDFLAMVRADEANAATVLLLGYYDFTEHSMANFDGCNAYLPELNARYEALAAQEDDLVFLSTSELMDLDAHPERIWIDGIHPSVEGSAALGTLVAETIAGM
jgi:acyl-CoA thioesterase I